MSTLTEDPGPTSNALGGTFPSEIDEREPDRWLVYGPTFVFAVRADNVDEALALVLVRLGYGSRPWLADNLNARHASRAEHATLIARRRCKALHVTSDNRERVAQAAKGIRRRDVRSARDKLGLTDGVRPGSGTAKGATVSRRRQPRN